MEKRQKMGNQEVGYTTKDWMLRFVKEMFIGPGSILLGVSGGALAAVSGIYERLTSFLAHLTKNFKENVLFFLPVGLSGVAGIFLLSFLVSFLLGAYETTILWFLVGCTTRTVPALWKEIGKKERDTSDVITMVVTFVLAYLSLLYGAQSFDGQADQNSGTWLIAGGLIGLGMIVPGSSPSNFLVYMGLYKAMADGFKEVRPEVIVPIGVGGIFCVLGLSKIVGYIFLKAYSRLFHLILGVVFASTIMIIPTDYAGLEVAGVLARPVLLIADTALGQRVSRLEEQYK